jgi:hypothetical protein
MLKRRLLSRSLSLYKVSKQPLANAKPPEKGALIYRYRKHDSSTSEARFKGALIYKVANRTSQNAVSHHVNKCPLADASQ